MASPGLFTAALQSVGAALSLTNWLDKLKADLTTINNGLVRAKLVRVTNQSIPDTTATSVSWSGVEYDSPGGSWAGGQPTRLVIPADGVYRVTFNARLAANNTGQRQGGLWKNGATEIQTVTQPNMGGTFATALHYCETLTLAAGDYLEVKLVQTSGGALNAETPFCSLSFEKIG